MKSRVVLCTLVLTTLAIAGCSSQEEPPSFALGTDLAAQLQADTGVAWLIHRERPETAPRILGPSTPVQLPGASHREKSLQFFSRYGQGLGPGERHELEVVDDVTDQDGSHETTIGEKVPGTNLPVFDALSSVRFDPTGNVRFVQSALAVDLRATPVRATVSEADARRTAIAYLAKTCGASPTSTPEASLGALPTASGQAPLAYRFPFAEGIEHCAGPTVFVDATSGAVLEMRESATEIRDSSPGGRYHYWRDPSDIKSLDVSQNPDFSYALRSSAAPVPLSTWYVGNDGSTYPVRMSYLGGWDAFDQGVSVDAHYHASKALDYFRIVHGRSGLDGRGRPLVVVTHDNTKLNDYGANAHYQPWSGEVHIGDGRADTNLLPLSLSFDILVHELAHGIVASTSDLIYEGQSGALNESFADVMGISAKYWSEDTRANADMRIGRLATRTGEGMRDLLRPMALGQPEVMVNATPCGQSPTRENDHCGVHYYSGIPNRAFSLMTLGGAQGDVVVDKAIGFEAARYVWFRAMTSLRNRRASFREAAYAQLFEAYALGMDTVASVGCAWVGVGVLSRADLGGWGSMCNTRPHYTGCDLVRDGYACNEDAPYSAYVCKNGSIAGGINCANVHYACRMTNTWNRAASVDANGALVCDPPPPPPQKKP